MARNLVSTHELQGVRVVGSNGSRKIGKIKTFVFHPKAKRCIGFIVKRPDIALMFRRKDMFVAVDGCDIVDGRIVISGDAASTDKAACKRLGVEWDECVLWVGLPVMCQDGTKFGYVGSVTFDMDTGKVVEVAVDAGIAANALLGKRVVPASDVLGFKRGIGVRLADSAAERATGGEDGEEGPDPSQLGAIVVSDSVKDAAVAGGLAEKAGQATAVARYKGKKAMADAKASFNKAKQDAKPAMDKAAHAAGEAVDKGAFALGAQLGKAQGMFAAFKEEYDKARYDGEPPKKS